MKYLYYFYLFVFSFATSIYGQCSFAYISNDTFFQDYIEFVYPEPTSDKVITIGSRFARGFSDDTTFNAPIFQIFDYCGNTLNKIVYKNIDKFRLVHNRIAKSSTYLSEPIGNNAIRLDNGEFLIVDKAYDTITNDDNFLIFINLDNEGSFRSFHVLKITLDEFNLNIKHVLELQDGRILVVLWDYLTDNYYFYYFNKDYSLQSVRTNVLTRGIRAIKEIEKGEFICTSLKSDSSGFQFYKLDTANQIKWIKSPYRSYGSAREILIANKKIYIVGSVDFGVLLICNLDGDALKEYRIDTFPEQRLCSILLAPNNEIFLSGYITHPNSNKSGEDVAIFNLDSNGKIKGLNLYDFRNSSGTAGYQGYYTDYGGFGIVKANDGGIITYGMSKYYRTRSGGLPHEDGILIKTEPLIKTNTMNENKNEIVEFELKSNLVNNSLNIIGNTRNIKQIIVYNLQGETLLLNYAWNEGLSVSSLKSGVYFLRLIDKFNHQNYFRFVKI